MIIHFLRKTKDYPKKQNLLTLFKKNTDKISKRQNKNCLLYTYQLYLLISPKPN